MNCDTNDEVSQRLVANQEGGCCPLCNANRIDDFLSAPDRFHLRPKAYRLRRCGVCTCAWTCEPPAPEEMGIHYDQEYHRAIAAAGEGNAATRWKKQRAMISRYKSGGALLDIGCSTGGFLSTMNRRSWALSGVEMNDETADRARERTGARIFVGDILDAPFDEGIFDVVTCFDVLEHVYRPRLVLATVMRWLKPGGVFYVMLPNIDSWEARMFGSFWFGLELPRHLFHFSPQSLRRTLAAVGFQELSVATDPVSYAGHSIGFVYSSLRTLIGLPSRSLSEYREPSFFWRAVRKGFRVAVIKPFGHIASWHDGGASIHGMFRKPSSLT